MAIDKNSIPGLLEDTQADVNPHEISDKIWGLIETYFENKYNVELTESFPNQKVTRPTIVCLTTKRTPGREGSKIHGKGTNFAKFIAKSPEGYVHEAHVQQMELYIEYSVYAPSTAEVKRIAWDLERAVLETVGILQTEIEGFQLVFDQQTIDSSMLWRQQDELIKRTIRFKVLLPIKYTKVVRELRTIEIIESWGLTRIDNEVYTRESSDKIFYVPVATGLFVQNFRGVYVKETDYPYAWAMLIHGTDYFLRKDHNQILYIEWNDDYGRVPSVGDQFRVDYDISQLVKSSTIKPQ